MHVTEGWIDLYPNSEAGMNDSKTYARVHTRDTHRQHPSWLRMYPLLCAGFKLHLM